MPNYRNAGHGPRQCTPEQERRTEDRLSIPSCYYSETSRPLGCRNLVAALEAKDAEIERLKKQIEIGREYATSRLCMDHQGKWQRGDCALCEIERLTTENDALREALDYIVGSSAPDDEPQAKGMASIARKALKLTSTVRG